MRDRDGRVLLVPAGRGFTLPGGTVGHGESPQNAVLRLTREQTGVAAQVRAARSAAADQAPRPGDVVLHTDRLIFDLTAPLAAAGGTLNGALWVDPTALASVTVASYAASALDAGVPTADLEDPGRNSGSVAERGDEGWPVERGLAMDDAGRRVQRFSTYALATDAAGRMLFAKIAAGYPGAGRWHLPGGGTDVGEAPADALLREVVEETGQVGTIGRLLSVSHRHNPVARGWEGYPINWHTIRVVYEMAVDEPTEPRVTEAAGSTVAAAWMRPGEIDRRALTDLASSVL